MPVTRSSSRHQSPQPQNGPYSSPCPGPSGSERSPSNEKVHQEVDYITIYSSSTIHIYAQFPKELIPDTDINLDPTNWVWARCLAFPVDKLNALGFSSKPYKWIRYATGVVVGAHGELCGQPDISSVPIDYDSSVSTTSVDLYYHTTNEEKRRMFPIDLEISNPRVVTSSGVSTRREAFRQDVEMRDTSCVVTRVARTLCDAAHILPHAKGDQYIKTFSTHRRRVDVDDSIVNSIDDVRNGLFLNKLLHTLLGQSVAFLPTPNFAMNTTDVHPGVIASEERFTYHLFDPSLEGQLGRAHSGQAIHVPSGDERSSWPTPSLFEAIYAGAVVHQFGDIPVDLFKKWNAVFYEPDGAYKAGQLDDKRQQDQADAERDNREKQKKDRQWRYNERQQGYGGGQGGGGFDSFDMLMMIPFMGMPAEKVKGYLEGCKKIAAEKEREALEVKVNSWREAFINS